MLNKGLGRTYIRYRCKRCRTVWYEPDDLYGMIKSISGILCDDCKKQLADKHTKLQGAV